MSKFYIGIYFLSSLACAAALQPVQDTSEKDGKMAHLHKSAAILDRYAHQEEQPSVRLDSEDVPLLDSEDDQDDSEDHIQQGDSEVMRRRTGQPPDVDENVQTRASVQARGKASYHRHRPHYHHRHHPHIHIAHGINSGRTSRTRSPTRRASRTRSPTRWTRSTRSPTRRGGWRRRRRRSSQKSRWGLRRRR